MLKDSFFSLLPDVANETQQLRWQEIEKAYSKWNRHYHTLVHLENMMVQLSEVKSELRNWKAVMFALFYHDIVYNPLRGNNEERSMQLAVKRMQESKISATIILQTAQLILSTKKHELSENKVVNYFLDADLSILGADWTAYKTYYENVRKEYKIYPNFMYNPGRKKVLQHFLDMTSIFKTDYFKTKFEKQAKENLHRELEELGK